MAQATRKPATVGSTQNGLRSWLANHRVVAVSSLSDLIQSWLSSLMTWLVIGVALALPTILYLLLVNVSGVSAGWEGRPSISVYLKTDTSDAQANTITSRLSGLRHVDSVRYISAADALKEFTERSGFGDVLASLDKNPLPPVVEVIPDTNTPGQIKLLATNIQGVDGVESVSLDLAWIQRLYAILALGQKFVAALAFFLGLGVLLSIGNTVRLAIENRRAEIEVVKLVGGTDRFVRRPFLYLGFWYGVGGAVLAWVMVEGSLWFLAGSVSRLVASYDNTFSLTGLGLGSTVVLLVGGGLLGTLGAAIAVRRHLHAIEPN